MAIISKHKFLDQIIENMKSRGYINDFELSSENCLELLGHDQAYLPVEVKMHEHTGVEKLSAEDGAVQIYALETNTGLKGILIIDNEELNIKRVKGFIDNVPTKNAIV